MPDAPAPRPGDLDWWFPSKEIEFFSAAREMDGWTRLGLYGFVLNGYLLTLFGTFLLVVELTTGPRGVTSKEVYALIAALLVCAHLVLEARSTRRLSVMHWTVFAVCIYELGFAIWTKSVRCEPLRSR